MKFPVNQGGRAEIRDLLAQILTERVAAVGGRVYRARMWPVGGEKKPALLVYGYAEQKNKRNSDLWRHEFDVACNMVVKVLCEGAVSISSAVRLEAECEAIAQQVERVILSAPELWGDGCLPEKIPTVVTQINSDQKERAAEIEATMQFELHWTEVFEMAEPDTPECAEATFTMHSTFIPAP